MQSIPLVARAWAVRERVEPLETSERRNIQSEYSQFLKPVGVGSQREIEQAVAKAVRIALSRGPNPSQRE